MNDVPYRVRVLVADKHPGLMPFTFDLPAENRDEAIKIVRRHVRNRSGEKNHRVRVVQSARKIFDRNGQYPYNNSQVH